MTTKKILNVEMVLDKELIGHANWVTSMAASPSDNFLISTSRDKSIMLWNIIDGKEYGIPIKRLQGHSHYVEDIDISNDGRFAISASCDNSLVLWDLEKGTAERRFLKHTNDVLTVTFSADNRQICSGSRDKSLVFWNTIADVNFVISSKVNKDWISCAQFSPKLEQTVSSQSQSTTDGKIADGENSQVLSNENLPVGAFKKDEANPSQNQEAMDKVSDEKDSSQQEQLNPSSSHGEQNESSYNPLNFVLYGSWDGVVKKFDLETRKVQKSVQAHDGAINALSISPDATLCATGGRDGKVCLLDVNEWQKLRELEMGGPVKAMKFNPDRYWLVSLSDNELHLWDLIKNRMLQKTKLGDGKSVCTSVCWSSSGDRLFVGFSSGNIEVYKLSLHYTDAKKGDGHLSSAKNDTSSLATDGRGEAMAENK